MLGGLNFVWRCLF